MKNPTIKHILFYLKKQLCKVILVLLLSLISVTLTLAIPFFFGKCIDAITTSSANFDVIIKNAIIILILIGSSFCVQWLIGIINNKITFNVLKDIRKDAFNKIIKTPLKNIDSHPYGEILSYTINDVETFADGLLMGFTQLFIGVFTIVGTFIVMALINWIIALLVAVLTPLSILIAKFISTKINKHFENQTKAKADETAFVDEVINNLKVVKSFGYEEKNSQHFNKLNKELHNSSLKALFFSSLVNPSTRLINSIIYALVCLLGCVVIFNQPLGLTLTVGTLSSLLMYSKDFMKPFNEISIIITELLNAYVCAKKIFTITDLDEEKESKLSLKNVDGKIDIDNVYFSYSKDSKLIENFNLHINSGMRVAIVGPTGAGKSTIINLLMRFYDVDSGSICVDNVNIQDVNRQSLRNNYGMVLQETFLKYGTIMDNLKMGNENATDEDVIKVSKETLAHNFIVNLKNGYQTILGDGNINLSVGEMQLLCITRVMLLMPPILILDEATSSIDTRTELKIQKAFNKLMKGKTSFIVAHRLSTIKEADIILVINNGNIIEQGNHQELLNKKGFYYNLYNSQFENV